MYDMLDISIDLKQRVGLGYFVIGSISLNVLYNISKATYNSVIETKHTILGKINTRKSYKVNKNIINDRRHIILNHCGHF